MLSTIPKLADKAFIIGYLFPVLSFFAALLLLSPEIRPMSDIIDLITNGKSIDKLIYLSLIVWGMSIFMLSLNQLLYKFLEGYTWPNSKIKTQMRSLELRRFKKMKAHLDELGRQWKACGDQVSNNVKIEYDELLMTLATQFPSEEELILPTRFGNAIRAFEDYSRQIYGADSIPLWVHLNTVIPKEFQTSVEDAR
jgi:hypothetical protein